MLLLVLLGALAARGESLAAFDGRCIPAGGVAPRSNTPGILGRRALPAGRLARLGATPDFHHGLLAPALPQAQAARDQDSSTEAGERILNAACLTCHDHRPVDTQALDEPGWTKVVKAEISRGARLKADDVPVLVDYLVKYHGPLPDGPGKELVLNICTQCHDLQRVRRERLSPEGWLEVLESMLNEGAPLSEKDLPEVLRYLARNFRPER